MENTSTTLSNYKQCTDIQELHSIIQSLIEDKCWWEKNWNVKNAKIQFLESKIKQYETDKSNWTLSNNDSVILSRISSAGTITLNNLKDRDIEDYIKTVKNRKDNKIDGNKRKRNIRNLSKNKQENAQELEIKTLSDVSFKDLCKKTSMQIRSISANAKSKVREYITNNQNITPIRKKEGKDSNTRSIIYTKKKLTTPKNMNNKSTTKESTVSIDTKSQRQTRSPIISKRANILDKSKSKYKTKMNSPIREMKPNIMNNGKIIWRDSFVKRSKKIKNK